MNKALSWIIILCSTLVIDNVKSENSSNDFLKSVIYELKKEQLPRFPYTELHKSNIRSSADEFASKALRNTNDKEIKNELDNGMLENENNFLREASDTNFKKTEDPVSWIYSVVNNGNPTGTAMHSVQSDAGPIPNIDGIRINENDGLSLGLSYYYNPNAIILSNNNGFQGNYPGNTNVIPDNNNYLGPNNVLQNNYPENNYVENNDNGLHDNHPGNYNNMQGNYGGNGMMNMMDHDVYNPKPVEPLFVAMAGFVGIAMIFMSALIFLPKILSPPPPVSSLKKGPEEIASLTKLAVEAIEGNDCTERIACEVGRAMRSLQVGSKPIRIMEIILPANMAKQLAQIRRALVTKQKCKFIACKRVIH